MKDQKWLLLLYQIPAKSDSERVRIWRTLQKIGAVTVKNSVSAVPDTTFFRKIILAVANEIVSIGGEAIVTEGNFLFGLSPDSLIQTYNTQLDGEYKALSQEIRKITKEIPKKPTVGELMKWEHKRSKFHGHINDLDEKLISSVEGAEHCKTSLAVFDKKISSKAIKTSGKLSKIKKPLTATWVTQKNLHVDKLKGFEISPRGALLDQIIEIDGDLGFAYERSCSFYKDFHVHDRLMFVCPRGTCQMEIRLEKSRQRYIINSENILSVPPDLVHDDEGTSSIYDTFALYADQKFVIHVGKEIGIKEQDIDLLYKKCHLFKRSKWIEQLLQEYFFRRVVKKDPQEKLKFFEEQIISELLLLSFEKKEIRSPQENLLNQEDSVAHKAIRYIETNLFSELDIESIAKAIGCSPSKFNKIFKAEFLKTPYTYIKERRLDEARCLLDKGQHNVTEVALMVGYENIGAFSEAFRKKYNKSPKEFIR